MCPDIILEFGAGKIGVVDFQALWWALDGEFDGFGAFVGARISCFVIVCDNLFIECKYGIIY